MTGFGRGTAIRHNLRAEVEIGSVNRKQLDIHVSLPKGLAGLEPVIIKKVSTAVSRGSINVTVRLTANGASAGFKVNAAMAREYARILRRMAKELDISQDIALADLINLPDVIKPWQSDMDCDAAWVAIQPATDIALKKMTAMRTTEGRALGSDIAGRIKTLEKRLARIRSLAPAVTGAKMRRLSAILREAGADTKRANGEAAMLAEKCDIAEEITRLGSHLSEASRLIHSAGTCGRTLDFLVQEIMREINTIGSKATDSRMSSLVVQFKSDTERIREQIQNIE